MKLSSILLENTNIGISLTKEEVRKVSSMVLEGYDGLTLENVDNNEELIAEISANVAFYSFLKEESTTVCQSPFIALLLLSEHLGFA